ncbi:MAG: stage II sporulation protein R [Clostridia bacterium]|nr:stage II sporulation protein R [Clostridia bacterium]
MFAICLPAYRRQMLLRALALLFALVLCAFVLLPLKAQAALFDSVLRFHVVANSDSAKDQEIKLLVRDKLLEWTGEDLALCRQSAEAEVYLAARKSELLSRVRVYLASLGVSYGAEVFLGAEEHAAKVYGDLTLPAGEYRTFRVVLGEGCGQNFFCVLFPPICQNSAKGSASETFLHYGVKGESVGRIKTRQGVEVRFFLWEKLRSIFQM